MLFFNKFSLKLKKKFVWFFCFLVLPPIEKLLDYCGLFFDSHLILPTLDDSPEDQKYKQQIDYATIYLQQLADSLLYEKYNSELVKQLLLYNKQSPSLWTYLGNAFHGLHHERQPTHVIYNGLYALNLYRLGFLDPVAILFKFWSFRKQLNIKSQAQYVEALKKAIELYCSLYPCDEGDKQVFEQLIKYEFNEKALRMSPWCD